jgi:hypothetical protein
VLRSRLCTGAIVTLLVVGGTACGGDDDDDASSAATSTAAAATTTTTAGSDSGTSAEFTDYIGLTVADATAKADADDRASRVVDEDGESLPVTMDFDETRLNFTVVEGKVTKVTTG